jgi:TATA-box binding protein (TBP) (component of TFIID and TFIIIB)
MGELVCVNIVSVCNIGVRIDLKEFVQRYPCAYRSMLEFPTVQFHFENPRLTFLIFSTGKVVIIGSQNVYANILAVQDFIEMLGDPDASIKTIQVQNYT